MIAKKTTFCTHQNRCLSSSFLFLQLMMPAGQSQHSDFAEQASIFFLFTFFRFFLASRGSSSSLWSLTPSARVFSIKEAGTLIRLRNEELPDATDSPNLWVSGERSWPDHKNIFKIIIMKFNLGLFNFFFLKIFRITKKIFMRKTDWFVN